MNFDLQSSEFWDAEATRQEVLDSLDLVARGEVWPLVTEKVPLEKAEAIHQRLDKGLITGRAALVMG